MQRQVGFTSILLVVYGLFALSARADDWDICLSAHGNEGIAACTRTIASGKFKNGELASAYYGRANARNAGGDIDGALADYDEAIRTDPKLVAAYVSRGVARHKKGDDNNALVDFDRAVQLDSNNTNAYFIRGLFRQQKGNLDGALADYDVTIRLDPKNASAFNTRGFVRRTKGDLDGAIADYDQAIGSTRTMHPPTSTAAWSGSSRAMRLPPWPITTRRSRSIRILPRDTMARPGHCSRLGASTRP